MIPKHITEYLGDFRVAYQPLLHERAVSAQELAASMHISGDRIAQSVLLEADGQMWMAVVPAQKQLDEALVKERLGAEQVRLLPEAESAGLFPNCEVGAAPPFGRLYGLRVLVDSLLAAADTIVFRAGSHDAAIEMRYQDYRNREKPSEMVLCDPAATGQQVKGGALGALRP